jgi:hypothetical protein
MPIRQVVVDSDNLEDCSLLSPCEVPWCGSDAVIAAGVVGGAMASYGWAGGLPWTTEHVALQALPGTTNACHDLNLKVLAFSVQHGGLLKDRLACFGILGNSDGENVHPTTPCLKCALPQHGCMSIDYILKKIERSFNWSACFWRPG